MELFQIILSEEDVIFYPDCIDAHIYVQVGDLCFPSEQWTDFADQVLSMWAEQLISAKGRDGNYTLPFEDGPFWIKAEKIGSDLCLKGINDRKKRTVEFELCCSYTAIIQEVFKAFTR